MNKDFDLNLKMDKAPSNDGKQGITSVAYCTPGCVTGQLCGSSECGLTRNCTGSIACA
ncbi:MAG: gallidermin/nisin family lantibiotic [Paraclostridium bifermentans]|uniref:gallidermin/nisin family lantibiotic n=1 Tax=Paraclostridium bifermentans TaxID=1490 RepID=UPI0011DDF4FF|nr:gallidermin/nisin family lantibiotic [Paraclostridium bifermentans]MBS6509880.1 gallidermin/nisin family lantibiotic [Paraclostridium bifermentans]MDU3804304.1 gallidermin/nisin family lantibiotic [Paraclostridium bifermentans]